MIEEIEIWKAVPGFPDYEASSHGRIRVRDREKVLKSRWGVGLKLIKGHFLVHSRNPASGYLMTRMDGPDGKRRCTCAHIVIAETFLGPKPTKDHQVAHWDGNAGNNRLSNLRWATRSENAADKMRHHGRNGGWKPCQDHHSAKLTNEQVTAILRRSAAGETGNSMAREFGVTRGTIYEILNGNAWRKLPRSLIRDDEQPEAQANRRTA